MTEDALIADTSRETLATTPPESTQSHKHFPALDGLRGVAILAVFISHFGGGHKSHNLLLHAWSLIAESGWMGVDLFFVLSGFLITGILYDSAYKPHHVKNFYIRRALRIFPLFYGVLFGFLLLAPVLHSHWQPVHILYFFYCANMLLLIPGFQSPGPYVGLEHFWSLAVEEQFYLLWPFVVWYVKDRKRLIQIATVIIALIPLLRVGLLLGGTMPLAIYELLFTRADSLLCGAVLALLVRGPAADKLPIRRVLAISALLLLIIFVIDGNALHYKFLISTIGYTVVALFCAELVYLAWRGTGRFARILNNSFLRACGRYSYGLYVYHGILIPFLFPQVYKFEAAVHSVALGGVLFLFTSAALTVVLSVASYHFFEQPILRLKDHFA